MERNEIDRDLEEKVKRRLIEISILGNIQKNSSQLAVIGCKTRMLAMQKNYGNLDDSCSLRLVMKLIQAHPSIYYRSPVDGLPLMQSVLLESS